jgi:hypothetical protein
VAVAAPPASFDDVTREMENEMINIRPLARGHLTGVVVVSARPQPDADPNAGSDMPIFFLSWRDAACSSLPYVQLPDAIAALLALERMADASLAEDLTLTGQTVRAGGNAVPASFAALWQTMPEVAWAAVTGERPHAGVEQLLGRSLSELHRVIVFNDRDLGLLGANEMLPETANATARDVAFTLVEAIEAEGTAHPARMPYSL